MMLQISGAATAKRSGRSQLMPMAPRIPAVELGGGRRWPGLLELVVVVMVVEAVVAPKGD